MEVMTNTATAFIRALRHFANSVAPSFNLEVQADVSCFTVDTVPEQPKGSQRCGPHVLDYIKYAVNTGNVAGAEYQCQSKNVRADTFRYLLNKLDLIAGTFCCFPSLCCYLRDTTPLTLPP